MVVEDFNLKELISKPTFTYIKGVSDLKIDGLLMMMKYHELNHTHIADYANERINTLMFNIRQST